jgi:ribosomal protein S18 acetylase RimI-like enzyme
MDFHEAKVKDLPEIERISRLCFDGGFPGSFELLLRTWPSLFLVATEGESIVGFICAMPTDKGTLWVDGLAVDPAHQTKGLGKILITTMIIWAKKHDLEGLECLCRESGPHEWYMRHGAVHKGTGRPYMGPNGEPRNTYHLFYKTEK